MFFLTKNEPMHCGTCSLSLSIAPRKRGIRTAGEVFFFHPFFINKTCVYYTNKILFFDTTILQRLEDWKSPNNVTVIQAFIGNEELVFFYSTCKKTNLYSWKLIGFIDKIGRHLYSKLGHPAISFINSLGHNWFYYLIFNSVRILLKGNGCAVIKN